MLIPQIVAIVLLVAVAGFFASRSLTRAKKLGSVQPGLDTLRASYALSRARDESDPVCVIAYRYSMLSVEQVTVGLTDRRILVVKGTGPLHTFAYDEEGEHLPVAQKNKERRGFFHWSHGAFNDGSTGYSPTVKRHPPFEGEEWRMYPTQQGFPDQKANLREFSRRFHFQWFYDEGSAR
jgi:hypothetical protein